MSNDPLPTAEDIEDASKPRKTLWKRLTSSTAAGALLVAMAGLGAVNGAGNLIGPSETPAPGAYDYAVTQTENGTRYTREHVMGVYKDGLLTTTVQKNVQVIDVSADRSDVSLSVGLKNETYVAGRKTAEKDLGSRFVKPGPVSLTGVGDQTAGAYKDANALNNQIYTVQATEDALNRIPEIELKREKNADTIRIIEVEQGGIDNAWKNLVRYNQLAATAEKNGMEAFFLEHNKVMTQKDMDFIIEAGAAIGTLTPSGKVVPLKDVATVLPDKGSFTAFDGKEFSYTSQRDLFRQVTGHYRQAAAVLAVHVHRYDGSDGSGGIPGPVSPEKVAEAHRTVSDFTATYGSYDQAEQKVGDIFRQDTIRLAETFAKKAQRTPAPQEEFYNPYLLNEKAHQKIESDGNDIGLLLPHTKASQVQVTVTQAPRGLTGK
ncbi:MAG: hypothetical protein ACAH83_19850 [Alphaproteobacteria bacterium]